MLKRRGYWRTLLGLRGELWYYSSEPPRKVADRPHVLSLLVGLLSPMLAVVAVYVSLESLKVGQRAYVVVQNGELTVGRVIGTPAQVSVYLQCELHNLGNTPASIKDVKLAYSEMPGWTEVKSVLKTPVISGELGPKAIRQLSTGHLYNLSSTALQEFENQEAEIAKFITAMQSNDGAGTDLKYIRLLANVGAVLTYTDVFSEDHMISWCYQERLESRYPYNCLDMPDNPLRRARLQ